MALIKLPYVGIIDSDSLDTLYEAQASVNGKEFSIDLNFENKQSDSDLIETVRHFIDNIRIHDINNKKKIEFDFFEEETLAGYTDHLLDELSTAEVEELIGRNIKPEAQPESLMKKLRLVRVGIYPNSNESFAIFDYSPGKEYTGHVIAIDTDKNGNFLQLNWEN